MRRSPCVIRSLVGNRCDAPVSGTQAGLVFVIALPLAVVVAMIFWPSDYDE